MRTEEEYLKLENELLKKEVEILRLKLEQKEKEGFVTFKPSPFPDPSLIPGVTTSIPFSVPNTFNPRDFPNTSVSAWGTGHESITPDHSCL